MKLLRSLAIVLLVLPALAFGQAYTGNGNAYIPGISSGNGNYGPLGDCFIGNGPTTLPTWQVCGGGSGTVGAGTAGQIATYSSTGTVVGGVSTSGLVPTVFNCDLTASPQYANLNACLDAAKTFAGSGAATKVLLPAGTLSLTAPYTLSSGMQITGVMPRDAYVANQPPDENMAFNGGTVIDCGGAANCFIGSALRGNVFENIGFKDYTGWALNFGSNNVDGISFSTFRNIYCIGSTTNNATTGCLQMYNFQHIRSEGLYAAYVNTGLSLINQYGSGTDFGNASFFDTFVSAYPKSTAIGNNGTCGVQVLTLAPSSGTATNMNDITFSHFQVNSYNSGGGTDDGTGYNVCVHGISGHSNSAIVIADSDIESNGNVGIDVTYTILSSITNNVAITNSYDINMGVGAVNNAFSCTSSCKFAPIANYQGNFVSGQVYSASPGTNPLYGFFADANGIYHLAVNDWNALSDGNGDLLYGQPVSVATAACTLATGAFAGCFSQFNGDCNTFGQFTSSSAITVTVPSTLPVGCSITLEQSGTGVITVAAGASASVHGYSGVATRGQYDTLHIKIGTTAGAAVVSYGQ